MRRRRPRSWKALRGGDLSTARSRSRSPTCRSSTKSTPNDARLSNAVTTPTALRIARYAEAAYAIIALVLAFGLPWPPRGQGVVLFAHWLGTALLAAAVCLRLGRPNRQTWYVAATLSAYVLFNAAVTVLRLARVSSDDLARPNALALSVGVVLWVTQAVVAACLYRARELRTMSAPTTRGR